MRINRHYGELQDSYLFSTIARRVADYQQAHPEADVIRLGIGDVTRPLCPAVTEALSAAVREMGGEGDLPRLRSGTGIRFSP